MKVIASLAVVLCLFSAGLASTDLKDIEVSRQGDSIYVDITTAQPTPYEHFMIKDAPEKIVVDLQGTINNWTKKRFSDLPFNSIERIRTSQFQVEPELVSRVVLDINRAVGYNVTELPLGVRVAIPASEDELDFSPWAATQSLVMVQQIKSEPPPQAEPEQTEPEQVEQEQDKSSQAEQQPPPPVKKPLKSTKVEEFPKRKTVKYEVSSSRDPFKSLVGQGSTLIPGQIPSVENLILVGVFDDESGRKALFEDSEGNGFILAPNDRVQNGYLVSINKDKAIFQITEYGWTRTVALNLQMPELK